MQKRPSLIRLFDLPETMLKNVSRRDGAFFAALFGALVSHGSPVDHFPN
jgi:hypothetical protein